MEPTIKLPEFTDEQLQAYIEFIEANGKEREKNFGTKDATAFAMGAAALFFFIGRADQIPAGWVFLPMRNLSPFTGKE